MKYYRIIRERDGHVDGDYASNDATESALRHWKREFPEDHFTTTEVISGDADYWSDMKSQGLVLITP
jgi:hypothetical protein